jgi:hypothetical protein
MSGSSVASLLLPSGPGSSIGAQLECDRFFVFGPISRKEICLLLDRGAASWIRGEGTQGGTQAAKVGVFHVFFCVSG